MAMQYRNINITAGRVVDKGVVDVEETECWERRKIHTVPRIQDMGKGTDGLRTMCEEFDAENEDMVIPTPVWLLANHSTISERRQTGDIAVSSVLFVVKGSKMA
jgi:hypothetical protein